MKVRGEVFLLFMVLCAVLLAGCTSNTAVTEHGNSAVDVALLPESSAEDYYSAAVLELESGNYRTAEGYFGEAEKRFRDEGDETMALGSRYLKYRAARSYLEYPYNRSGAEAVMKGKIPDISEEAMDEWLDTGAQTIHSDGEVLYYEDIASDFLYANYEVLQRMTANGSVHVNFDYISQEALSGDIPDSTSPYVNPIYYRGVERLAIPAGDFTKDGILNIWFPLPVETESQRDVTVENLSYEGYIVEGPVTEGPIGYVYYAIPAGAVAGDLVISADIGFTSYEQIFDVDPALVGDYDRDDPEYRHYTSPARNIELSDEIIDTAEEIIGNEGNPYLRAQLIYDYIITNYPYSHVPHLSLDTVEPKVAESTHMFETGHGDCGTQSMLFSALCRAVGIPARATGGYQMVIVETPGSHFWAEYYIEGYGWIPCDPTVADIADWVVVSEDNRTRFKEFYSHNLDARRFIIQTETDAPMLPAFEDVTGAPGDAGAVPVFRLVLQTPSIVHDESAIDIDLLAGKYFRAELEEIDP
jgi:transglutaminase-like putative cysteine protease